MTGIARNFFMTAVGYGLLGMLLGLHMAMSQDHGQMPTHAHIMVIGWVSFALFGFYYHLMGDRVPVLAARIHFWLAELSFLGIAVGLWLLYSGTAGDALPAFSSIAYAISFLIFAYVFFKTDRD